MTSRTKVGVIIVVQSIYMAFLVFTWLLGHSMEYIIELWLNDLCKIHTISSFPLSWAWLHPHSFGLEFHLCYNDNSHLCYGSCVTLHASCIAHSVSPCSPPSWAFWRCGSWQLHLVFSFGLFWFDCIGGLWSSRELLLVFLRMNKRALVHV